MKNVPLPVVSKRLTSGIFNILHELLHKRINNHKPSYTLLSRAIKLGAQTIELNWFSRQFGFFFPFIDTSDQQRQLLNQKDGTPPELVTH